MSRRHLKIQGRSFCFRPLVRASDCWESGGQIRKDRPFVSEGEPAARQVVGSTRLKLCETSLIKKSLTRRRIYDNVNAKFNKTVEGE